MTKSLAPYGELPEKVAKEHLVFDRQNYRLISRMWSRCNEVTRNKPPILELWESFCLSDQQVWLPLGENGIDRWFIRAVNATVWYAATNVGRNVVENLQRNFAYTPTTTEVKEWLEENEPNKVNHVVHECVPECSEEMYHILFGKGIYCRTDRPVSEESAKAFYLTMAWWCSEEGRLFLNRYKAAYGRLYKYRDLFTKNNEWHKEQRRHRNKTVQE